MNYTISNDKLKATFSGLGAELKSLQKRDDNLEYMWQADPAFWGRTAPVLFPIVGKLKNDMFTYEGKSYRMSQHGFARDQAFMVTFQSSDEIHFLLAANESTLAQYPFAFEFFVKYRLDYKTLSTRFEVINTGKVDLPFSIGGHPAFHCPHQVGYARKDYSLQFELEENTQVSFLTDGLFADSKEHFQGNILPITDHLFDRDAWVFENLNSKRMTLLGPNQISILTVDFAGFPYLGIWSKNQQSPFVCIEPWQGLADSADHTQDIFSKKGIIGLPSGQSHVCEYRIETLL